MSKTLKQVRATVSPQGEVVLEEPLSLERTMIATVSVVIEEKDEPFTEEQKKTLERRSREMRDGSVKTMSLEELQQSVAAKLA